MEDPEDVLCCEGLAGVGIEGGPGSSCDDACRAGLLALALLSHGRFCHAALLVGCEQRFPPTFLGILCHLAWVPVRVALEVAAELGNGCVAGVFAAGALVRARLGSKKTNAISKKTHEG